MCMIPPKSPKLELGIDKNDLDVLTLILKPQVLTEKFKSKNVPSQESLYGPFVELSKELFFLQSQPTLNSRKVSVLKTLVLQTGAFLQWDLDILDSLLPLPLQTTFFDAWFEVSGIKSPFEHSEKSTEISPDQEHFSVFTYSRWIIKTLINLSIPGGLRASLIQQFLKITPEESKILQIESDQIIIRLKNEVGPCINRLESLAERSDSVFSNFVVSNFEAFGLTSNFDKIFNLEASKKPEPNLHKERLLLDLTSYYFFVEDYEKSSYYCSKFRNCSSDRPSENPDIWESYFEALGLTSERKPSTPYETGEFFGNFHTDRGWTFNSSFATDEDFLFPPGVSRLSSIKEEKDQKQQQSSKDTKTKKRNLILNLFKESSPEKIKSLLQEFSSCFKKSSVTRLTVKWNPDDNNAMKNSVKSNVELSDLLFVLNCKLTQMKKAKFYEEASSLYSYIQSLVTIPLNVVQCQTLSLDLCSLSSPDEDVIKRCKKQVGRNNLEDTQLTILCLAKLLNSKEWEFLSKEIKDGRSLLAFGRCLARLSLSKRSGSFDAESSKTLSHLLNPLFTKPSKRSNNSSNVSKLHLFSLILKLKHPECTSIIISYLLFLFNASLEDPNAEVMNLYFPNFERTVNGPSSGSINVDSVVSTIESIHLEDRQIRSRILGEMYFARKDYSGSLKHFLESIAAATNYFVKPLEKDDKLINKMIKCCTELCQHFHALVLCQFIEDYASAFRLLEERNSNDAMDGVYTFIWDITILEYAVTMHARRGETRRKKLALEVINDLELNTNNNEEILNEASLYRKSSFLRKLCSYFFR